MPRYAFCKSIQEFRRTNELDFVNMMMEGARKIHIGHNQNEIDSWRNSFIALSNILRDVNESSYIAFEVICPGGGRIDCMLFGKDKDGKKHVIHIELKQWDNNNVASMDNIGDHQIGVVLARVSETRVEPHAHPSKQAYTYQNHIRNLLPIFENEEDIELHGFAYCYNYREHFRVNCLFDPQYQLYIQNCPLYCRDTGSDFSNILSQLLQGGCGDEVCEEFFTSPIKQTRFLIDTVCDTIQGRPEFQLIGNQCDAEAAIYAAVKEAKDDPSKKHVIIVKGGPGTGKTVIALQVLAQLFNKHKDLQVYYTTRSSALRDTLRDKLGNNQDVVSKSIYEFNSTDKAEGEVDVLLVDEAHRISSSGNSYYYTSPITGEQGRMTYLSQTMSLIYSSKVCVFFIDDHQAVTNTEIGTSRRIREIANNYFQEFENDYNRYWKERRSLEKSIERLQNENGDTEDLQKEQRKLRGYERIERKITPKVTSVLVEEINLTSQFRCAGSDNYLDWIDNVLYRSHAELEDEGISLSGDYPFEVLDSPQKLEAKIRSLDTPYFEPGITPPNWVQNYTNNMKNRVVARLVAGWCWPWEDGYENGDLRKEVVIENWNMPWETKNRVPRGHVDDYAPSANLWASDYRGINQVGVDHSSQGFEFDYVGVILGPDIRYDSENDCICIPAYNKNLTHGKVSGENHDQIIRNIYRVLMTRGKKGCYIYCCDEELNKYFKRLTKKQ